jgi:rhodanese-related sulfurtransferase
MHLPGFLLAAGAGACLWAGLALGAGWLLKDAVQAAIGALDRHTGTALAVVLPLIGAWLGWKLWQKYRFRRSCTVPHITPDELIEALRTEQRPLILDLRGATMIAETGAVPGATVAEHDRLDDAVGDWPRSQPIVTLCACPEDAGAIAAARHLLNDGYLSVRVLHGGYDAWLAATRQRPAAASVTRPGQCRMRPYGIRGFAKTGSNCPTDEVR